MIDPSHDRKIGGKLPRYIHARHAVLWSHVDDWAQIGAETDASVVFVMIRGPQAVFAVSAGLDRKICDDGRLSSPRLNDLCVEAQRLVGVGKVACRWHQKTEFSGRARWPHNEHDIFFGDAGAGSDPQAHGIDAALETGLHRHAVRCFPAAIGHRIGVEFNAAELGRINSEAIVLAVPIPTGHRSHGVIESPRVESMRAGVGHLMTNAIGRIVPGSVPIGEHRISRRQSALPTSVEFGAAQDSVADSRTVNLSGVQVVYKGTAQSVLVARAGNDERNLGLVFGLKAELLDNMAGKIMGNDLTNKRIVAIEHALLIKFSAPGLPII